MKRLSLEAMKILRWMCAVAACWALTHAGAFCGPSGVGAYDAVVREYYDAATDRYFLAWSHALSPGSCYPPVFTFEAPAGTTPTGLGWRTVPYADQCIPGVKIDCSARAKEMCQFRAASQPGPASRFYTINPGACQALKQAGSGWIYEPAILNGLPGQQRPSLAAFELDTTATPASCPPGTVPVHRFYNGRHDQNLGNHRYVADEAVRQQMKARAGWTEEGVAFCAQSALRPDVMSLAHRFAMQYPSGAGSWNCVNGFGQYGSCIEAVNMVMPLTARGPYAYGNYPTTPMPASYVDRTGVSGQHVVTYAFVGDEQSAQHSFVQLYWIDSIVGVYLSSYDRLAGWASGMRTWYRTADLRPFSRDYEVDMDLVLEYQAFVRQLTARSADGRAYALPMITFRDADSGRRVSLAAGSLGNLAAGDFAGRHPLTGNVLVGIALGSTTSIGRSAGLPSLQLVSPFASTESWGRGGDFAYRINRGEFARVLERARQIDPALSPDPADYAVEGFGMQAEVDGDADIGYNVRKFELSIVRP